MGNVPAERRLSLRKAEHPLYQTFEGSVRAPGEGEPIECFLVLGRDHFTVELKSLSPIVPEAVMGAWIAHLGPPTHGPFTQERTGEIEESCGEVILTATWRFPPEEGEVVKTRVDEFVEARRDSRPHR